MLPGSTVFPYVECADGHQIELKLYAVGADGDVGEYACCKGFRAKVEQALCELWEKAVIEPSADCGPTCGGHLPTVPYPGDPDGKQQWPRLNRVTGPGGRYAVFYVRRHHPVKRRFTHFVDLPEETFSALQEGLEAMCTETVWEGLPDANAKTD